MNRLITFALIVLIFSCRNERVTDNITFQNETKTNLNSKNEVSSRQIELNQIKQPNKTVFRNLKIDTTKLFGLWSQDPTAIFADFNLTSTSFTIVGYEGKEKEPYILDKNIETRYIFRCNALYIILNYNNCKPCLFDCLFLSNFINGHYF